MSRRKAYQLHIQINLEKASPGRTGKALGRLFRSHLNPEQMQCRTENVNDTEISFLAETVIQKLLGRRSARIRTDDRTALETKEVFLDDARVDALAAQWGEEGPAECVIVVPHIFYLPLFQCFVRHLELRLKETLGNVCVFFDYAILENVPDVVKQCFMGERRDVLDIAKKRNMRFIDPGRQLYLENLISLACYMINARYLIFMDDDFFIDGPESLNTLLGPLKRGYLMAGRYAEVMDRLHTCFFGIRPEVLRDALTLFDNGENHYSDKHMDTGTVTYRTLSKRERGVFITDQYRDDDDSLGRHLTHCTTEMWVDLPQIIRVNFDLALFPKDIEETELDTSILLEALADLFDARGAGRDYQPVDNELRQRAAHGHDFSVYIGRVYSNYQWLSHYAAS